MRGKIWSTIEEICLGVIDDQAAGASGAVVDLDSPNGALIEWHTTINPDFETYLKYLGEGEGTAVFDNTRFMMLMNCTEHGRQGWIQKISKTIPLDSLIRYDQLGGRGCTTKVALRDGDAGGLYVFKGVDLRTFLTYIDGESDDAIKNIIKTWHHANNVVADMPPQQNIMKATTIAVPANDSGRPVICGCLYHYCAKGDVSTNV
jgi:hypothetical protein